MLRRPLFSKGSKLILTEHRADINFIRKYQFRMSECDLYKDKKLKF